MKIVNNLHTCSSGSPLVDIAIIESEVYQTPAKVQIRRAHAKQQTTLDVVDLWTSRTGAAAFLDFKISKKESVEQNNDRERLLKICESFELS